MLTDAKLRSLKPKDAVYRVADSQGLCIEVRPWGSKIWRYRYRFAAKANMLSLGEYPGVTLAQARSERDKHRALVKAGSDPVQVARIQRAAQMERAGNTFAVLADELMEKRAKKLTPGSVVRERRLLERDLGGFLGSLPIHEISAPLLLQALRKIEARGALETAHRARAAASLVFRYAIATGRATGNPATDLAGALTSTKTKHFASITEPADVARLLRAIWSYQGSPIVSVALKLSAMLFVRPGELRHARWSDINLDTAEWRYTTSKTKTPHIVPLPAQAVALLHEVRPFARRSEFVFPGARSITKPISENTINAALRYLGFENTEMTAHGFRAMARTLLDEVLGFRPDFIEHQLAHAVRDPLGRAYNRTSHLEERKKMMQAWADYLDALRLKNHR
ncbi:integrase arm-type DNA-binding domain-containing protein [Stenotrophomonas maltophilia]|uniref:tyrosine-type recombinase/integrase n=1 Tax=Stenotrophomonas maltophilia TaxID=40324 RepID=UPI002ACCB4F3|nr:integrase arm-type DNA-binding domain-containing protein [Stenotrophomonas maltophilia]MDZ5840522.1 integrase arm-type DNA-binding domain-containing protein [Stenotrophomonas maltophilia]HDS1556799.1 integrase arm-type DNA-binding domain-containing protein [Stenotrophomonas maltophilia]